MKTSITKVFLLLVSILLTSCASIKSNAQQTNIEPQLIIKANGQIKSCPVSTRKKPVIYIVVAINEKGVPADALTPTRSVTKLDLRDPNLKLTTIIDEQNLAYKGRKIKRKEKICFVSAQKSTVNASGYKFSPVNISVLWRPDQKTEPENNIVIERIPSKSPIDISYKFTIASEHSDPENGKTYLDPRIVIRRL